MNLASADLEKAELMPSVSVIIVNYNGGGQLEDCLGSVFSQRYSNSEVIVVDNASEDGSIEKAERGFSIRSIRSGKNLGFSAAVNMGVKQARGEVLFILNHDVELESGCIETLARESSRRFGLFMPKLLLHSDPTLINSSGGEIHYLGFAWPSDYLALDSADDDVRRVGFASGGALAARKDVLEELGLYDPYYFSYYDDVDLGWRARMLGIESYVVTGARAYHHYSFNVFTVRGKLALLERNRLTTLIKNYSIRTLVLLLPPMMMAEAALILQSVGRRWSQQKISAYAYLISHLGEIRDKRSVLQCGRRVSDRLIVDLFRSRIGYPPLLNPITKKVFNPVLDSYWRFIRRFI